MALVALVHEHRANLLLEEGDLLGRRFIVESVGRCLRGFFRLRFLAPEVVDLLELIGGEKALRVGVELLEDFLGEVRVVFEFAVLGDQLQEFVLGEFAVFVHVAGFECGLGIGLGSDELHE